MEAKEKHYLNRLPPEFREEIEKLLEEMPKEMNTYLDFRAKVLAPFHRRAEELNDKANKVMDRARKRRSKLLGERDKMNAYKTYVGHILGARFEKVREDAS